MLVDKFPKVPSAFLDYALNWTLWLQGDSITTSTWSALGSGDVVLSSPSITAGFTIVWVEGGVAGELVDLVNKIETASGRRDTGVLRLILRD